nr:hypothetical protein [Eubacterium sp.]
MEWKAPKSVRQIGDVKGKTKIYVEDYVMSYARRLAKEGKEKEMAGVLLGHRFYHAKEKVFLVSGMVCIKAFHQRESDIFTQEIWTDIYTEIKENFTDLDVVGWCYTGDMAGNPNADRLLEVHRRNFSEDDRLFYIYEEKGQADDFFLYENGGFAKQKGYYIYYEKNPEMRHYMMQEENRFVHIVEQEDDRVLRNIRGVLKENEERKKEHEAEGKWGTVLASLVVVLGLVFGVVVIQNQNGLSQLKEQMQSIQTELGDSLGSDTTVQTLGAGVVSGQAVSGSAVQTMVESNGVETPKPR